MIREYEKSRAVQTKISIIEQILLNDTKLSKLVASKVARTIAMQCIPAGVKACINGKLFNLKLVRMLKRYKAIHEKYPNKKSIEKYLTEIPDWYIEKEGICIVGYNQVDLWSGGSQCNRAYKYLLNDELHKQLYDKFRILMCCVVERTPTLSSNSKISTALRYGIEKHRLFHVSEIINQINSWQRTKVYNLRPSTKAQRSTMKINNFSR